MPVGPKGQKRPAVGAIRRRLVLASQTYASGLPPVVTQVQALAVNWGLLAVRGTLARGLGTHNSSCDPLSFLPETEKPLPIWRGLIARPFTGSQAFAMEAGSCEFTNREQPGVRLKAKG